MLRGHPEVEQRLGLIEDAKRPIFPGLQSILDIAREPKRRLPCSFVVFEELASIVGAGATSFEMKVVPGHALQCPEVCGCSAA